MFFLVDFTFFMNETDFMQIMKPRHCFYIVKHLLHAIIELLRLLIITLEAKTGGAKLSDRELACILAWMENLGFYNTR